MKIHNKLVRDKIPDIIKQSGRSCSTCILDYEAYRKELKKKLYEEVDEFIESGDNSEIADILEVLHAFIELKGLTYQELEKIRLEKREERGGFSERIYLKETE